MKILVYGDSNTWGDNFFENKRIPDDKQWINILNNKFDGKHSFIQEGLPGRIAGSYDDKKYKNGLDSFLTIFRTSAPVDILIISLGTNDLQLKYNRSVDDIFNDLMEYENIINKEYLDEDNKLKFFNNRKLKIIYIMPVNFDYKVNAAIIFDEKSEEKRLNLIDKFIKKDIIVLENADLFEDGIHLNYEGHKKMANIVYEKLVNYEG